MPSPFPGMDPYLEDPEIWTGVHAAVLAAIFERLGPAVRPKYVVRYQERVYVTSEEDPGYRLIVPDVRVLQARGARAPASVPAGALAITEPVKVELVDDEIHEQSLAVIDPKDRSIVTVIELLSPTNKALNSYGRESFLKKRREVCRSDAHWVEIDLLREGDRTANFRRVEPADYPVYLSRASSPRTGYVWCISLRERLPVIAIPLRGEDPDVPLDLQTVLGSAIERGSYDLDTDYTRDPMPPLTAEQSQWARQVTASRAARNS